MNTAATRVRSSARPVSFSTMEARITSSCGVFTGRSRRAALPDLVQGLAMGRLHGVDDLLPGHAALELVGVRQQRPFARGLVDVAGEDIVLVEAGDDLVARQAFRNRDRVQDGLALRRGCRSRRRCSSRP